MISKKLLSTFLALSIASTSFSLSSPALALTQNSQPKRLFERIMKPNRDLLIGLGGFIAIVGILSYIFEHVDSKPWEFKLPSSENNPLNPWILKKSSKN